MFQFCGRLVAPTTQSLAVAQAPTFPWHQLRTYITITFSVTQQIHVITAPHSCSFSIPPPRKLAVIKIPEWVSIHHRMMCKKPRLRIFQYPCTWLQKFNCLQCSRHNAQCMPNVTSSSCFCDRKLFTWRTGKNHLVGTGGMTR